MTGADTPSITVRQYGDAASIRSLITRQPDNTEFLLCWKGKYIVGITNVPAESHFNVRYEYDNNAVIAHDFFADDPYPGVLTIEASESSDPTPVADFETELRAFLQTVGVSNVALSHVTRLSWWNTNAAFYEIIIHVDIMENADWVGVIGAKPINEKVALLLNGHLYDCWKESSTGVSANVLVCNDSIENFQVKSFSTAGEPPTISLVECNGSAEESLRQDLSEILEENGMELLSFQTSLSGFDVYDNIPCTEY